MSRVPLVHAETFTGRREDRALIGGRNSTTAYSISSRASVAIRTVRKPSRGLILLRADVKPWMLQLSSLRARLNTTIRRSTIITEVRIIDLLAHMLLTPGVERNSRSGMNRADCAVGTMMKIIIWSSRMGAGSRLLLPSHVPQ